MSQHWKKLATVAYGCSLTRLALNYYTYFEDALQEQPAKTLDAADKSFHKMLGEYLTGGTPAEELEKLRDQIREEMETLTAYVDGFQIYEYVLNRMERRFFTDPDPVDMEEEELSNRLVQFIVTAQSPVEMNGRIQQVIGQLPVRFTRSKFYHIVQDALTAYIGSDQSSLEQMLYLLRSGAMTETKRLQNSPYQNLADAYRYFGSLSFKELEEKDYREAVQRIGSASGELYEYSDAFLMLEDLVNDLLVVCLTRADAMKDQAEEDHALAVLDGLYRQDQNGEFGAIAKEVTGMLPLLEGVQERYFEKYQQMGGGLRDTKEDDPYADLAGRVELLLSDSPFASLQEMTGKQAVEKADAEKAAGELIALMDPVLSSAARPVSRAIMANVLSLLPVFFGSADEIREYIKNSLTSCTDPVEKGACMELLLGLMENEEYALV